MSNKMLNNYQRVQAKTASPAQRVIMVYNGIEKNIRQAIELNKLPTAPENVEKIHDALQLAEQLILELKLALDMENGGEIAQNLNALYDFWRDELTRANIEKDTSKLPNVADMIKELTTSWRQAAKEVGG